MTSGYVIAWGALGAYIPRAVDLDVREDRPGVYFYHPVRRRAIGIGNIVWFADPRRAVVYTTKRDAELVRRKFRNPQNMKVVPLVRTEALSSRAG